jgi:hypothetical protein
MKGIHLSVMCVVKVSQGMAISNGILLNTMEGNLMSASTAIGDFQRRET